MNTLRNSVKLIGRLDMDPEVKLLDTGKKMATFSLATREKFKTNDGNSRELTEWHSVVVWGNLAVVCEKYLKKGKEIAIDGRLSYRNWVDKNGTMHFSSEIVASELLFLGSNGELKSNI